MRALFWAGVAAGLALWVVSLRRRLHASQLRGDMFRDAALRLERAASGAGSQER